jgi:putative lipoic acid-binding regulatory protein
MDFAKQKGYFCKKILPAQGQQALYQYIAKTAKKLRKGELINMKKKYNGNGKSSTEKLSGPSNPIDLKEQKIEYPITYNLKAVMDGARFDDDNKNDLVTVFKDLEIVYAYLDKKLSSKGTYVSFTYQVTLISKDQLYKMYDGLRAIESLKFAL